jgi:hypothetical protein
MADTPCFPVRRAAVVLAIAAVAVLTSAHASMACTCMSTGPACQSYWSTPMVFDAVAHSVDESRVALEVLHVWKGAVPSRLVVRNGYDMSCTLRFQAGQQYLVFADEDFARGRRAVSLCSGTHAWNGSGPDAEFLESLSRPGPGGRITGSVRQFTRGGGGVPDSNPLALDVPVRLTAPAANSTIRSKDGDYLFTGLAPGRYQLSIDPPATFIAYPSSVEVDIPDPHACAWQSFSVTHNGRIAGRLVTEDGRSVEGLRLELVTAAALANLLGISTRDAYAKADGSFEFGELPAGDYVVGVNLRNGLDRSNPYPRIMYSAAGSEAHVLSVKSGERIDLGTWRLPPPAPIVAVSGVVTWEDGRPATGVLVSALDQTGVPLNAASHARSQTDGRFAMQLWQQRTYRFRAELEDGEPIFVAAPTLTIGADPPAPIRIVVRRAPREVAP